MIARLRRLGVRAWLPVRLVELGLCPPLVVFFYRPHPPASLLLPLIVAVLAWIRLEIAVALIPLALPYYLELQPLNASGSVKFSLGEIALLICLGALLRTIVLAADRMLLAGARSATCLDVVPWMQGAGPDGLYPALIEAAMQDPEKYQVPADYVDLVNADPARLGRELMGRITYRYPQDIATTLPGSSLDIIFSHVCFEHFADPDSAIAQIARLLRPGGVTSHEVDLRHHRYFNRPLGFLRYNDTLWKLSTPDWPNGGATAGGAQNIVLLLSTMA